MNHSSVYTSFHQSEINRLAVTSLPWILSVQENIKKICIGVSNSARFPAPGAYSDEVMFQVLSPIPINFKSKCESENF